MPKLSAGRVISRQKGWAVAAWIVKASLVRMLTSKSMEVFLRGNDVISLAPLTSGAHEPHMTDFFRACAEDGFDDFFIDVGANIGLTSYQVADLFGKFYAFEPNPLAFNILQVNIASSAHAEKFSLYNFGIGDSDGELSLVIPKKNWGGAFVDSPENSYDADVLAAKDNFSSVSPENYIIRTVKIRSGTSALEPVFSTILASGGVSGVVKIDVEGFELSVVRAIARAIPGALRICIVFENWDASANLEDFVEPFAGRATAFKLERNDVNRRRRAKPLKILRYLGGLLLGASDFIYRLEPANSANPDPTGDIVLLVDAEKLGGAIA